MRIEDMGGTTVAITPTMIVVIITAAVGTGITAGGSRSASWVQLQQVQLPPTTMIAIGVTDAATATKQEAFQVRTGLGNAGALFVLRGLCAGGESRLRVATR